MAGDEARKLDQTPTWAVAGVCAIIIIISIALEKLLHKLGKYFTDKHKKHMYEALEKVKAELMILGFISLILTFTQYYIAEICIPVSVADTMLPCAKKDDKIGKQKLLLSLVERRFLAGDKESACKKGKVPIITVKGLHQLHILIFFLAVFHVAYSAITMTLGRLKIRGWKQWEEETSSHDYEFSNDPSRFRLTHETSFVRAHTSFWTKTPILFYIGCFFRQFVKSVNKADYMAVRHGFIHLHFTPGRHFDFQKYIKRSLEDDYKVVVGISPLLWATFVIFLLLNVDGWRALLWGTLIPLIIILAVGTKLQAILTKMALEITERHAVIQGMPVVQASDRHFWFSKPQLMLHLIHFVLFQSAFQITYFFWIWYEYKLNSCFHDDTELVILKLVVGVGILILCSYITLPLYALISQMGTHMKKSIFDEHTNKALKQWQMGAKKKHGGKSPATSIPGSPVHPMASTVPPTATLHRYKTTGHSTQPFPYKATDASDFEDEPVTPESSTQKLLDVRVDHRSDHEIEMHRPGEGADEFSFAKPAPPPL